MHHSFDKGLTASDAGSSQGVAIIGMACMFPGAPDVASFWQNIVSKVDAVSDPPDEPWNMSAFYDPDSNDNDRVYCKRGGYLGDIAQFDPVTYGIMPNTVDGGEPDQWLALKVAYAAMADAGYLDHTENNLRTEVILGKGTYINRGNLTVGYHGLIVEQILQILRNLHPEYTETDIQDIKKELKKNLPPFSADTAPALIGNIVAGRLANRLNLMGPGFTVDAACASALIATEIGVRDLLSHKSDLVLAGGIHVNTPAPTFMLFCQLNALSRKQQIRPFDQDADGTILGEGLGMVVLKRLEDARRDMDRIYAVIKGVGTSSDGRAVHVMAPRLEGEELALQRAYEMAGISTDDVGLVEAHGTATPVGDVIEVQALRRVFGDRKGALPNCALGSVKSMIGHTMPAAGMAGLIKSALAIYHKVLPPTLNCEAPDPKLELDKTPFYINSDTRPWINGSPGSPRCAGVNSFGFGGVNAHVVLQEELGQESEQHTNLLAWENEVCILEAGSRQTLIQNAQQLGAFLKNTAQQPSIKDVAYSLNTRLGEKPVRLSIVASSSDDLVEKLDHAIKRLSDPKCQQIKDNRGIYFFSQPVSQDGKLAFMFPGEGAQYTNMLLDLCMHFPEVRECFDLADQAFLNHPRNFLPSDFIFPRPSYSEQDRQEASQLWQMDGAVEAVLIGNWAMWTLMKCLEIQPDVILGHSTGDYSAMFASGIIQLNDKQDFIKTITTWNNVHEELAKELEVPEAVLLAVAGDSEKLKPIIDEAGGDIHIAMDNCPHQSVIVGEKAQIERVVEILHTQGIIYEQLPFDRPYHTPIFEQFANGWCDRFFARLPLAAPSIPVYSCTSVEQFPDEIDAIKELFVKHWIRPVKFRETIEQMYADDVRVFLEVGARGNLTSFVDDILRGEPHLAITSNVARRSGISQINHMLGQLTAQRIKVNLGYLYARRDVQSIALEETENSETGKRRKPAQTKLALGVPTLQVGLRPQPPTHIKTWVAASATDSTPESAPQPSMPAAASSTPALVQSAPSPVAMHGNVTQTLAMHQFTQNMESFLDLQQEVMQSYLAKSRVQNRRVSSNKQSTRSYPLLGNVESLATGQELVAMRHFDPREDTFLSEHALGGQISQSDPSLRPICVVPLTISMEILAEAAAMLMPEKTLVAMREIQALRWIQVDEEPVTVHIEAKTVSDTDVKVNVYKLNPQSGNGAGVREDVIQGTVVFAQSYPAQPPAGDFPLSGEKRSRLAGATLYDGKLMFHGACFQGVVCLERSGEDGLTGQLEVLPAAGMFRSTSAPNFVTDPVVLDAAGQLVGFWTAEHLEKGFVVFPYRLKELRIYQSNQNVGERLDCRLKLQLLGDERIRSDIDILRPDGTLWMRLKGWEDRRFDLPVKFHQFWVSPKEQFLASPWDTPVSQLADRDSMECYRAGNFFKASNQLWQDLWASLILGRIERKAYYGTGKSGNRQLEWLLGRTAAKDAARIFLKKHHHMDVFPADIEIGKDVHGRPVLKGEWMKSIAQAPIVTISHSKGIAVAIVSSPEYGRCIGVDLQELRKPPAAFLTQSFTADEQQILASFQAPVHDEWVMRFWCAKEAVGKALGRGLIDGPLGVRITVLDKLTGTLKATIHGQLATLFPEIAKTQITVNTIFEDNYATAVTLFKGDIS